MSLVRIEQIKDYLRITHDADDTLLQQLIDGAEDEALQYLDRDTLPRRNDTEADSNDFPLSDSDDLAPSVRMGIYMIVQAMYEGKDADEVANVRRVAEIKWHPYRNRLGA